MINLRLPAIIVVVLLVLLLWAALCNATKFLDGKTTEQPNIKRLNQTEETMREMDFAYGRMIQLGSDSPLYRFSLDTHVYRNVADSRMADLRIFNRQKKTVSLQIKRASVPHFKKYHVQKLLLFPIFTTGNKVSDDLMLHLKNSSPDLNFSFELSNNANSSADLTGVLVDLGEAPKSVERLVMELGRGIEQYKFAVKISCSSDLSNWEDLSAYGAVADMIFSGHRVTHNHIDLPAFTGRYLRLSFSRPLRGDFNVKIMGLYPVSPFIPSRQSTVLEGRRSSSSPAVFTYDSKGYFPTDQIHVKLPRTDSLVKIKLSSRPNKHSRWHYWKTAFFYNFDIDGALLEREPITVPMIQDRLFRIEIVEGAIPADSGGPQLVLLWHPHECAFVASGEPPFMLAYGNANIVSTPLVVDDLLEAIGPKHQKRYMGFSRLDAPQILGGKDRLECSDNSRTFWISSVLWSILLLGVLGLAAMAFRLHRQMAS